MSKTPLRLLEPYPVASQDFNAIENAWGLLKDHIIETMPTKLESRDEFVKRLKTAVAWVNKSKRDELLYHCSNRKERAEAVLWNASGRTEF